MCANVGWRFFAITRRGSFIIWTMRSTCLVWSSVCFSFATVACSGSDFVANGAALEGGSSGGSRGAGGNVSGTGGAATGSKSGSGGTSSGGATGSGAVMGNGGRASSGGTSGSGGARGSGGGTGSGGTSGSGGVIGAGGIAGGGGVTATGGFVSSGGKPGSGGSGGGTCPSSLPQSGAPCGPDPLQCSYGSCCPTIALCQSGGWNVVYPPCMAAVCPSSPPTNGSVCSCQLEGKTCDINQCTSGGTDIQATCSGGKWTNENLGCVPDPCAANSCHSGTVCMATVNGGGTSSLQCEPSSCSGGTSPDPCSCIGTACTAQGGLCTALPSGGVLCTFAVP